jgi:hypothetical protein
MKRLGKMAGCLACGLMLSAGLHAEDAGAPNNPYSPIAVRNVFGLNPLAPPETEPRPSDPPPKITPNGIMSIFGQRQALFRVTDTSRPGQPVKDVFYTLSEGDRQDGIEIIHIDEATRTVAFNNHGIVQEIPLADMGETGASSDGNMGGGRIGYRSERGPGANGNIPMRPGNASEPAP